MQAKISKFIAAVLVLVIVFANSWSVVSYAAEVFLSEKELENQNTTSKDGSVDFDVQYTNGKHSATLNIDEKNTKLNIAVSLKKSGYVKDLAIDFSSSNFEIAQINDENGNEVKFEFLDLIELDDEQYVVLLPVLEEGEEDDGEVVILKVEDTDEDSEEESYVSVENEETLMKVFNIFKDKFKDEFDFVDSDE